MPVPEYVCVGGCILFPQKTKVLVEKVDTLTLCHRPNFPPLAIDGEA